MKVLFAGGGTGGHVNPALAIAGEIKAHRPETEFLFMAVPGGMEDTLIPKAGYPVAHIQLAGFQRSFKPADVVRNLKAAGWLMTADRKVRNILSDFAPDLVVGTGGYLSGPVVKAAAKMGIPTAIHEQNAFPGVTTKLLSKVVDVIFLAFPEAQQYLPEGKNYLVVGNPVRQAFTGIGKWEARQQLGLDDGFTILSFGGSLGAKTINEMAADLMQWHAEDNRINHIHGYGKIGRESFPQMLSERGVVLSRHPRLQVKEYIDNMHLYFAAADLIISRAGAISISELEVSGKPSVLFPYPYAAENHQYYNAKVLADAGASILIEDKDYNRDAMIEKMKWLYEHPEERQKMSAAASALAVIDTPRRIYDVLMELAAR